VSRGRGRAPRGRRLAGGTGGRARRRRGHAPAQPGAGGLRAVRTARRHGHGNPGRQGQRRDYGRGRDHALVLLNAPPDAPPPPRPGRPDRLGEARRAEHARSVRHAHPVGPARRGVVGAGRQYPAGQIGRRNLQRLVARIRRRGHLRAWTQPAQALVPCHRVQPGPEPVRITQPVQLGRRDQEGVEHRLGGFPFWQHRVAAGVERRGVLVVRRGEAIRFTCDDGRHQGTVLHALTVVRSGPKLGQNGIPDIRTT
jgi:hypothetical protein